MTTELINELREAANVHIQAQLAEREAYKNLIAVVQKMGEHQHASGETDSPVLVGYINPKDTTFGIQPTKVEGVFDTPVHICILTADGDDHENQQNH